MYYSAIGILAAMILIIENQDILLKRSGAFELGAWKEFRRFLFAVLVYYVTDILWGILETLHLAQLLIADTSVYFIVMAAGILFWTRYAVIYLEEPNTVQTGIVSNKPSLTEEENGFGLFLIFAGRVTAALAALTAVVNLFVPVLFSVDENCVYRPLPLRYVILTMQIVLLILISVYALVSIFRGHGDPGKRKRYRTLALFGTIMAVFLFVQIWFPYLPLYSIAYMLGISLLRAFIVGDEKEAYREELEEAARTAQLKETISSLLDHMPGRITSKDAGTGVYLAANQAFADYAHAKDPDEVVGVTAAQLFDSEKAAHIAEDDRTAISMDEPYVFFEDVKDDEGNIRQFQTTKLKYTDAAGRLCLMAICQDVTDMVRIQRDHAMTKEEYEKARSTGIMYSHIAQSMTRGYEMLCYVNVDSEEFIVYRMDDNDTLNEERRGYHFFEECRIEAERIIYPDDLALFKKALDRKTLVAALDRNKTFVITFRVNSGDGPYYISLRASRMEDDERYIILGVTDIDEQMKQRRLTERIREERIAYNRLSALAGDFLSIYVVVPETGRYREFSSTAGYETISSAKEGQDFFGDTRRTARSINHPEDLNRFLTGFTKENVLSEIERHGIFTLSYRVMMENRPLYVQLKAAMVEEMEGRRLVVGVSDIDAQVSQEEAYVRHLAQAKIEASIDALTHVKNRHAYLSAEEHLDQQIAEDRDPDFAIVILDVNDLKKINDTDGHKAGDQYLCDACAIICDIFDHSPVFRIGGDEFAVIVQGRDYERVDELVEQVRIRNENAQKTGGIVIACGMAKREKDRSVASVFERADQKMYDNKCCLKAGTSTF